MRNPPKSPLHLVLVGPMGAGKSSIGRLLAARLQRMFVDLDSCIEADAGTTINAIFAIEGEAGFRMRECAAMTSVLANTDASIIATGGGAVLEAGNRRAMREAGNVIYLHVDATMQLQRLQGDSTRPLLATANPAQRMVELKAIREPLYREVADLIFDTTHHSAESAANALATLLGQTTERCA